MSFKLLAIRPLDGCEEHILNNLQVNKFYFFDDSYKQYKDHDFIIKKENYNELNPDFYYNKNENTKSTLQSININAIVGKNGSGKSSIIEFLLRLLNNFFKGIDKQKKLENLIFIEGIVGELYILQNNIINKIYINFSISKYKEKGSNKRNENRKYIKVTRLPLNINEKNFVKDNFKNKLWNDEEILATEKAEVRGDEFVIDDYFFTMYVNYSLYGLDSFDFLKDSSKIGNEINEFGKSIPVKLSWIDKVLHKNDGYQTPLVIHPYRESAMIDVRREKDLMWQRFSSLLFLNPEYRNILPETKFTNIHFIAKESAFEEYINNIFNHQNQSVSFEAFSKQYDNYKREELSESLSGKINYLVKWIDDNKILLGNIKDIRKRKNNGSETSDNNEYDLNYYLLAIYAYLNEFNIYSPDLNSKSVKIISFTNYYSAMLLSERNVKYDVLRKLNNNEGKYFEEIQNIISSTTNMNYETLISAIQLSLSLNFFKEKYNISKKEIYSEQRNLKNDLFWYCVVKSVKTLKYKTHHDLINSFELNQFFLKSNKNFEELSLNYFKFVSLENKSHITDKLRRATALLDLAFNPKNGIIHKDGKIEEFSSEQLILYYDEIIKEITSSLKSSYDNDKLIKDLNSLGDLLNNTWQVIGKENIELMDILPPPIFKYEFYSNNIPLSKISSGQFQKIGLLSSIVYHLKNLDSIQDHSNLNTYKQVLVVLDEIELYFHPAQQREFINDLVQLLKLNKFKQIENINIFFITHSPFILSDIPSQNVLKLDKGKPFDTDNVNSFGANIHDLLADEFFMSEGFIGDFAHNKIAITLNWLKIKANELKQSKEHSYYIDNNIEVLNFNSQEDEYNYHRNIIELIGEPLVKNKLRTMFLKLEENDPSVLKDELDKARLRVFELEKKLSNA